MENNIVEDNPKTKSKGCLVVLLVLLLVPILAFSGLYFGIREFRMGANALLSGVPGPIGTYFGQFPTQTEEMENIRRVSDYMLKLDVDRAVDKLLLLQKDDRRIYDEVIKDMLRINPNKTRIFLEAIRQNGLATDVLKETLQSIEAEQSETLKKVAAFWESLPSNAAVDEVEKAIEASINGHKEAAAIFEHISDARAVAILYKLDVVDRNKIFSYLSDDKRMSIKNTYTASERRKSDLKQLSGLYGADGAATLAQTIGGTDLYSMDDLAIIYKALGAKKAGEVLAKIDDEQLVFDIIGKIKANEILEAGTDLITPDILKSLKIYREFDDNVKELVDVYAKMNTGDVVKVVRNMMVNATPSQVYTLDNGDLISISDEDLIVTILEHFPQKKIAEILSALDETLASELTRKLALPQN